MMTLLPAWVPSDAIVLGLVVFLIAVLLMNRNRMRMVNVVFEREAAVIGIGVVIAAASSYLAETIGGMSPDAWMVGGLLVAVFGIVMWWR